MSRRRQRGAAYRLRRKFRLWKSGRRASPFITRVDPTLVALLKAPLVAAADYNNAVTTPEDWAEYRRYCMADAPRG